MADKAKEWTTFVHQCLFQRIPEDQFYSLSKLLVARNSLPGSSVVHILLRSRASAYYYEPLVPKYVVKLYLLGHVSLPEILVTLLRQSLLSEPSDTETAKETTSPVQQTNQEVDDSLASDYNVIQELTIAFTNGTTLSSGSDISRSLSALSQWITAILSRTAKDQTEGIGDASLTASAFAGLLFEAVGILLVALLENQRVMRFIANHQG
jgi:hypothetical protein